jgi:hypothetical protein
MWISHPDVMALKDLLKKHGFDSEKTSEIDLIGDEYDIDEPDTDTLNTNEDSEQQKNKNVDASDEEEETEEHGDKNDSDDDNVLNRYTLLSNLSND